MFILAEGLIQYFFHTFPFFVKKKMDFHLEKKNANEADFN